MSDEATRLRELEARLEFADRGLKTLTDAGWELAAKCDRLRAIIEGRTAPPTDAEIEAHWRAGGTWVVEGVIVLRSADAARSHRDQTSWAAVPWVPMRDGRPCAWPVASEGGAS